MTSLILLLTLLVVLLLLRLPVAFAMLLAGACGYAALNDVPALLAHVKTALYGRFSNYDLAAVPLFLLMGEFASRAGIGESLFRVAARIFAGRHGGTAFAAMITCGLFSAICGSSLATASAMTRISWRPMRKAGLSPALSSGTLAAGGTLGVLIPPSVVLVILGVAIEENVIALFAAALVPGILAVMGHMLALAVGMQLYPPWRKSGTTRTTQIQLLEKSDLRLLCIVAGLFALIFAGFYASWFTPTEAAASGMLACGALAWQRRGFTVASLVHSLLSVACVSGMLYMILVGADLMSAALAIAGAPKLVLVLMQAFSPWVVLCAILLVCLLLGTILESLSIVLLLFPLVFPGLIAFDFGLTQADAALWFAILALVAVEMGLISPPLGLNLFMIRATAKTISPQDEPDIRDVQVGVIPFLVSDCLRLALLMAVPSLVLSFARFLFPHG